MPDHIHLIVKADPTHEGYLEKIAIGRLDKLNIILEVLRDFIHNKIILTFKAHSVLKNPRYHKQSVVMKIT